MIFALGLFVAALLGAWLVRRRNPELHARLVDAAGPASSEPAPCSWRWIAAGAALLALAVLALERLEYAYFTQDDVLVGELPRVLTGCRLLWSGVWPSYDPYTMLGSPLADLGLYSLTYPPTWLSYAVARHVLGNEYLTFEAFAVLHLFAAYFATLHLARMAGAGGALAVLASLSFVLSGPALIMGRSWHMVLPAFFFLPLLLADVQRVAAGPLRLRTIASFGLAAGLFFHVGFPQVWFYTLLFAGFSFALLVASGRIPFKRALAFLPAPLLALGVAMPLLVPQLELSAGVQRPLYGNGVAEGILAMLLPWPLVSVAHPNGWGSLHVERAGLFYYYGSVFAWLAPLLPALALSRRGTRADLTRFQWLILAALAFALALGPSLPLWPLLSELPVFRTINNNPFRLLPFVVLFTAISGAAFLDRALPSGSARARLMAFGAGTVLLAWLVGNARPAFYNYGFRPYPKLPTELAASLGNHSGRLLAITPVRSTLPDFHSALPHNLPGVLKLAAFDGYDPVIEGLPPFQLATRALYRKPVVAGRRYGLQRILLHDAANRFDFSYNYGIRNRWAGPMPALLDAAVPIARHGRVSLFELPQSDPLAFRTDQPERPLSIDIDHGELRVDLGRGAGPVSLNFLHYERMTAVADGLPVALEPDSWGRIRANLPPGARKLVVRYQPRWSLGLALGVALCLLSLASWRLVRNWRQ